MALPAPQTHIGRDHAGGTPLAVRVVGAARGSRQRHMSTARACNRETAVPGWTRPQAAAGNANAGDRDTQPACALHVKGPGTWTVAAWPEPLGALQGRRHAGPPAHQVGALAHRHLRHTLHHTNTTPQTTFCSASASFLGAGAANSTREPSAPLRGHRPVWPAQSGQPAGKVEPWLSAGIPSSGPKMQPTSSQPRMTWPTPMVKTNGWPLQAGGEGHRLLQGHAWAVTAPCPAIDLQLPLPAVSKLGVHMPTSP